jgi:GT2 family glycosyltransferase
MVKVSSSPARVSVDGKFFRDGEKKFFVKGVSYGPFAPNAAGQPFVSIEQTTRDLAQIRELGANVVRIYHVPARWFFDLALETGLKLLIDIPWNKHLCFLDSVQHRAAAVDSVRRALYGVARHPAVFAFSIGNEIPSDIVRWSGTRAVADFIDELVQEAKRIDSQCLCTYTNFPPTEFLRPQTLDFVCFNLYLHNEQPFKNYLARLQLIAESKPLLLGEFGIDSIRESEPRKCELLEWQIRDLYQAGLSGGIIFSYTDEWYKDGREIEDWGMGLTTRAREPKPSFGVVQRMFRAAPYFPSQRTAKVSVIVASYNGERTLKACLDSLERQNYPDYEVILVDDGSTDTTSQIAAMYPRVRYIRHERNLGLSVARNTGIAAATGEIVAFTDSDCRADEDWLYYLTCSLFDSPFAAIGGPNLLPPEDSPVAAAVMASPGGPAAVMLTDRQAEHIPGCNMAVYKSALEEIGGFDPIFRKAGDDVDLCWRLEQTGHKIGFSPAAFVWHYRRSTIRDYLNQQYGYGEAEALLVRKHPEYFNSFGGSMWRGRIYTASKFGVLVRPPIIYRGLFGSAGFQSVYSSGPAFTLMLCTALEYHVLITLPLWLLSLSFHYMLPLAITSLAISVGVCAAAANQAELPKSKRQKWSRPLVAVLFFLQPIVRGWARYHGRLFFRPFPGTGPQQTLDSLALQQSGQPLVETQYWLQQRINRLQFVAEILRRLDKQGWPNKADIGWSDYDLEIYGDRWCNVQLTTVAEDHPPGKQLIRCRLSAKWSLQSRVAFWLLCALELLIVGFLGGRPSWWVWAMLFAPLAVFVWFIRRQERSIRSLIMVFLDELAKEWNLIKVSDGETRAQVIQSATPEEQKGSKTSDLKLERA